MPEHSKVITTTPEVKGEHSEYAKSVCFHLLVPQQLVEIQTEVRKQAMEPGNKKWSLHVGSRRPGRGDVRLHVKWAVILPRAANALWVFKNDDFGRHSQENVFIVEHLNETKDQNK